MDLFRIIIFLIKFNSIFGGIPDNNVSGGGFYSGSQYLELNCYNSSELVSAMIYANDSSVTTFELRDDNGFVLADTTYTISPGAHRIYFNFDVLPSFSYSWCKN